MAKGTRQRNGKARRAMRTHRRRKGALDAKSVMAVLENGRGISRGCRSYQAASLVDAQRADWVARITVNCLPGDRVRISCDRRSVVRALRCVRPAWGHAVP